MKSRWDIACDHAVNSILHAEGLKPPPGTLIMACFEGMTAEEIIEELMYSLDDQVVDKANALEKASNELANAEKGSNAEKKASKDVAQIEREMQKLLERRSQMFNLLSTFSKIENEMSMAAINNMGRI